MAVREQSRARVIYSLPEQRRLASRGGFGLFGMLVLALLLFAGGLLIGRWSGAAPQAPAAPRNPAASPGAEAPAGQAPAGQTAASGRPAVVPRPITVNGEQVWSGRAVDGVPVGWERSREGAIGAATNYTVTLASGDFMFYAAKRRAAVAAVAAPRARAGLQRDMEDQAGVVAASLLGIKDQDKALAQIDPRKVVFQTIPVRWRVDQYDGVHASVSIWQNGVGGYQDSSLPPQEAWGITTVQLEWIDKDWKETGATVRDGPVPVADSTSPTPAPDFVRETQQFKEYHYAPGS